MQRARNLFTQNKIAIIWDFDKTLIPYDMQRPLFEQYGVDEATFWQESNALPEYYRALGYELVAEQQYLQHILSYVRAGRFKGLSNSLLRQLGARLTFYEGLPALFQMLKDQIAARPEYHAHDIAVEHYVLSSGLRQMILGSAIAPYLDGVWACEFSAGTGPGPGFLVGGCPEEQASAEHGEISGVLYAIDDTSKTRVIFEINKGSNWHPQISVNAAMAHDDRRVPFENMIYVADGPSDVPVFSVVNQQGGKTLAVYTPGDARAFARADHLQRQGRVQAIGPADYTSGSQAYLWLSAAVDEIAQRMVTTQRSNIECRVGLPPAYRAPTPAAGTLADRLGMRLPDTSLAPGAPNGQAPVPPTHESADDVLASSEAPPELSGTEPESLEHGTRSAANGLQLKIDDLPSDDEPLFHLPGPGASFEPRDRDLHDDLLAIVSEISGRHPPLDLAVRAASAAPVRRRAGERAVARLAPDRQPARRRPTHARRGREPARSDPSAWPLTPGHTPTSVRPVRMRSRRSLVTTASRLPGRRCGPPARDCAGASRRSVGGLAWMRTCAPSASRCWRRRSRPPAAWTTRTAATSSGCSAPPRGMHRARRRRYGLPMRRAASASRSPTRSGTRCCWRASVGNRSTCRGCTTHRSGRSWSGCATWRRRSCWCRSTTS